MSLLKVFHTSGVAAVLLPALSALPTHADIIPGMPDVIVCSVKDPTGVLPWERMVFYVSAELSGGKTLYKSATSDPVILLVDNEGIVTGANLADCDGRSIDSLRADGRALTFVTAEK
jgi:hypothetical protein